MGAMMPLPSECDRVLIDEAGIAERVWELGGAITRAHPHGELRLITVLRGGLFFLSDLCRAISTDVTLDFLAVAPYVPGGGASVRVTKDLDDDIAGCRVILVEDIVDTGLTLNYVLSLLQGRGPKSIEVCALLDKPARRIADVPITYRGFEIPDRFLVGYGLDLGGRYRNLPYIAGIRDEVMLG